ncbi:MAG TPA: selenide, water dikinase SelD [Candidatus Acidoferrales bacterium]|nr:selenide, water dikinase SelD [Candidatus Acidoferrales bacterium]
MNLDLAKRSRVMERSQRLGHCICDVQRTCPCDVLREQNLCPCAGERPGPADVPRVKLMDFARNAGCASKIAPADLEAVLARLPAVNDPAVISGLAAADDAAIYRLAENLCLVQTVDVFTPCVDDARLFGRICAANCLSDIYAMGGTPRTALSVLAFPAEKLPGEIVFQMLSGAMEKFAEAGVALVGGHSVKDEEIKLGFSITGVIDPSVAAALEKPAPSDFLVLTKPLGTGVLAFARQIGREYPDGWAAAENSMMTLNRAAAEAMEAAGATACTDVTGFGLFAHLRRMLRVGGAGNLPAASGGSPEGAGGSPVPPRHLGAEIFAEALPAFPGAVEALREGLIPGAIERNREYVGEALEAEPGVEEARVHLGFDAQTSGGLLIAVPFERLGTLRRALEEGGAGAFVIGRIVGDAPGKILVRPGSARNSKMNLNQNQTMNDSQAEVTAHGEGCCADVFKTVAAGGAAAESQKAFGELIRSVQAAGVLDAKTKELILFSLVVGSRCQPCFATHFKKARELGLAQAELDEAAWCAIAMGGAPVKMFYQECLRQAAGQ